MATARRSAGRSRAKEFDGIDADYSDVEYRESDIYDGPEPTRGLYRLELVHVGKHVTEEGNKSTKWLFRVADGEENKHGESVAGWKGSKYTNSDAAAWVEQNIAVALGLIKPKQKLRMSYEEILRKAKPCRALIAVQRVIDDEGKGYDRAELTSSFLADDGGAAKTRSRAKSRDAEPEEPEEDDESGSDVTEEELQEYAEELEGMDLAELKALAKEDHGVTIKRGMKADAIIDAILADVEENGFPEEEEEEGEEGEDPEEDDEEEEPEEEPEPPKSRRAGRSASSARTSGSASKTRGRRGHSEDPPF